MKGLVTKSTGSWYNVLYEGEIVPCRIKGKFRINGIVTTNPVSVGDVVTFEEDTAGQGIITEIEPRKNYIIRKSTNLSKQAHIIAANLDYALLVITLKSPQTTFGFIDRFLVTCEAFHVPAVLVFNKEDIYEGKDLEQLNEAIRIYQQIGYTCIKTSAETGVGLEEVEKIFKDKVTLLSGQSGVGKSSLLNAMFPNFNVRVGAVSKSHKKGQHTTTFAEMFQLPNGGHIIDTPGIKGFGLYDIEKDEIGLYYPEMKERLGNCKFYNCKHINEPGCAVLEGLETGEIALTRYDSYLGMQEDTGNPYR